MISGPSGFSTSAVGSVVDNLFAEVLSDGAAGDTACMATNWPVRDRRVFAHRSTSPQDLSPETPCDRIVDADPAPGADEEQHQQHDEVRGGELVAVIEHDEVAGLGQPVLGTGRK